jgi:hypothetical protein
MVVKMAVNPLASLLPGGVAKGRKPLIYGAGERDSNQHGGYPPEDFDFKFARRGIRSRVRRRSSRHAGVRFWGCGLSARVRIFAIRSAALVGKLVVKTPQLRWPLRITDRPVGYLSETSLLKPSALTRRSFIVTGTTGFTGDFPSNYVPGAASLRTWRAKARGSGGVGAGRKIGRTEGQDL